MTPHHGFGIKKSIRVLTRRNLNQLLKNYKNVIEINTEQ